MVKLKASSTLGSQDVLDTFIRDKTRLESLTQIEDILGTGKQQPSFIDTATDQAFERPFRGEPF